MTSDRGLDTVLVRLGLSFVAGLALGWNPEELGHPAGLRTIVLICLAACTAMLLADWMLAGTHGPGDGLVRLDTMRLAQGVLVGIGVIGAGTILKQGSIVRGVTAAATVRLATVIGLCFGAGAWSLGAAATGLALVTLQGLRWAEQVLRRRSYGAVTVEFDAGVTSHAALLDLPAQAGLSPRSSALEQEGARGRIRCLGAHGGGMPDWALALLARLRDKAGIVRVAWEDVAWGPPPLRNGRRPAPVVPGEGERTMMKTATTLLPALALGLVLGLGATGAEAKGCLKGAVVGGVAGHMAGHGKAGAAAGCAIGHHEANKKSRQPAQNGQPQGQ